ncbi:MAG TPA: F0F1 ATP synthase subunit B [Longimicrobiaceae bacterium]|nr:F0F1 ATP synthase subunit B [Longimicrobiaceae bacterium]
MKHKSLRLIAPLIIGSATPVMAQEGGLLTPSGGLMFWTVLTFGVVLAALWKFAWPHILGAVEAREEHIRELIAAAARDREEAKALLEEQKKNLEDARIRTQEIVAESRAAGERVREEVLTQARQEQEDMLRRAQSDIRQQVARATEMVRAEAVELSIAAAEKLLERNLDSDDNRRLVREYLDELGDRQVVAAGA